MALASATNSINRNEVLNKLLLNADTENSNHVQPNDSKNNIKVAFAEGYLAANNSTDGKTGYASKFFKVSCRLSRINEMVFQRDSSFISDLHASCFLSGWCGSLNIVILGIEWLDHQVGRSYPIHLVLHRFNVSIYPFRYQVGYNWAHRSRSTLKI